MELKINPDGIWYHGSDRVFTVLRANSTVTQWRELAEAFSHRPTRLSYDDGGAIRLSDTPGGGLSVTIQFNR